MIGYEPRDGGGYVVVHDGADVGYVEPSGEGSARWAYWHYTNTPIPCAVLAGTGPTRSAAVAEHHTGPTTSD